MQPLIAVMSDSHDNIWNLRKAIKMIKNRQVAMIIHCGDFVAPFTLKELEEAAIPVHGVFGNNDGDQYLLTLFSLTKFKNIKLHGMIGEINAYERHIGFVHQKEIADGLICSGKYDLVCYGHSHKYHLDKVGKSYLLNPGEIMGKDSAPSFVIVNPLDMSFESVEIGALE